MANANNTKTIQIDPELFKLIKTNAANHDMKIRDVANLVIGKYFEQNGDDIECNMQ